LGQQKLDQTSEQSLHTRIVALLPKKWKDKVKAFYMVSVDITKVKV